LFSGKKKRKVLPHPTDHYKQRKRISIAFSQSSKKAVVIATFVHHMGIPFSNKQEKADARYAKYKWLDRSHGKKKYIVLPVAGNTSQFNHVHKALHGKHGHNRLKKNGLSRR